MTNAELVDMETRIRNSDQAQDTWAISAGVPRPSVVTRLIAEVRERRRAELRQYAAWNADSERNVSVDDVLREIKEKS